MAKAWRRIGWRSRNGIAKPPNKMTSTLNSIWACYEEADPGTEDWAEVYKWLSLAAMQGHEGAKKFMTVLESKLMTPEQVAQGQKRAREFKPR